MGGVSIVCYICDGQVVLELKNGFGNWKELPAEVQGHVNTENHLLNKVAIGKQYEIMLMKYEQKHLKDSPAVLAHWQKGLEEVDELADPASHGALERSKPV